MPPAGSDDRGVRVRPVDRVARRRAGLRRGGRASGAADHAAGGASAHAGAMVRCTADAPFRLRRVFASGSSSRRSKSQELKVTAVGAAAVREPRLNRRKRECGDAEGEAVARQVEAIGRARERAQQRHAREPRVEFIAQRRGINDAACEKLRAHTVGVKTKISDAPSAGAVVRGPVAHRAIDAWSERGRPHRSRTGRPDRRDLASVASGGPATATRRRSGDAPLRAGRCAPLSAAARAAAHAGGRAYAPAAAEGLGFRCATGYLGAQVAGGRHHRLSREPRGALISGCRSRWPAATARRPVEDGAAAAPREAAAARQVARARASAARRTAVGGDQGRRQKAGVGRHLRRRSKGEAARRWRRRARPQSGTPQL